MKKVLLLSCCLMMASVGGHAKVLPYLPNNAQWTGENVYQGAELMLAYDDGNAEHFSDEQSLLFEMTSSWMTGAAQGIGITQGFDKSAHGARCRMYLSSLTLVDIARKYANFWTSHPDKHSEPALVILADALLLGHPCQY